MGNDPVAALVCGPWRVERIDTDYGPVLRVSNGRVVVVDCPDATTALSVLTAHGAPLDRLLRA